MHKHGIHVPNYSTKTVDCSSYVTWVLVESGVDGFTENQYQETSGTFYDNEWGFEVVSVADEQAGDILVYSGHVEIVAEYGTSTHFRVYNCGGDSSIQSAGTDDYPESSMSGHSKSQVLKVLRVN